MSYLATKRAFALLALVIPTVFATPSPVTRRSKSECRCFPGDTCWPTSKEWSKLNKTLDGKLVATVPLGDPCHDDGVESYDSATCASLQENWFEPELHYETSSSVMAPYFANQSCDPFLSRTAQCVIGTYIQYAIDVSEASDVETGIAFAKKHNIRLVVRNTGHDYLGKSTGAGALGLWMHHLKDITFSDWSDSHYTGKAIKMGAGVQGFEAYEAADARGLQVVGGECATVGLAGGYTQGGGHSALSSKHGLAADQALEWEVVTGSGEYLIANRDQNTDLYWALSGGGGGTYGVVLSLTSKAHTDSATSGMNLTFTSTGISQDDYYEAIATFHSSLPAIVDAGVMSVWYFTNESFAISPITGPDVSVAELKTLLSPLMDKLDALGITYTSYFEQFSTYLEEFNTMQGDIQVGTHQYGGRFIPRSVIENDNQALTDAYRYINNNGGQFVGVGVNVSKAVAGDVDNAVNPGWRTVVIDSVILTPWSFTASLEEMEEDQVKMTEVLLPQLEALTPDGAAYLNEGDFRQPDWQTVFYGDSYDTLLEIKNKYDPDHMFYATTAVGSEYWEVQSDKRLCKA